MNLISTLIDLKIINDDTHEPTPHIAKYAPLLINTRHVFRRR